MKLFYDGDSTDIDVESYRQKPVSIRRLSSPEQCSLWQSKVSYESGNSSFSGSSASVTASCSGSDLLLTYGDAKDNGNDVPVGGIVGGVIGALVVIAIVVAIVIVIKKRKDKEKESHDSSDQETL